ncbi:MULTISPECIES: GLPGLI family protein [unclassified Empedobacter]|uniref:GLPGLI family protein n=1 Tax=unclassified Empedobacter TaxID=2643773 RepID=UPI0025C444E6|nr:MULTISPECIES: GLPGLI family protein [unclassified Empedobacter]
MKLLYYFIIFIGCIVYAQPQIKTDATFNSSNYSQTNFELSDYNITYDYKVVRNIKNPEKAKAGLALLQIGKRYNKFVDYNRIGSDSIDEKHSHLGTVNANDINISMAQRFKSAFRYQIIIDKEKDQLTFADKIYHDSFFYKETLPKLDWKLLNDTKQILNYTAKKATVNYGGRKWTAWYTDEIPMNAGPYKFYGLPGLILEIYDDKEHYHFTANASNQNPKQIYLAQGEKTPIKVKKTEFYKAEKDYHENAAERLKGVALDENKKAITNFGGMPYNPIELE